MLIFIVGYFVFLVVFVEEFYEILVKINIGYIGFGNLFNVMLILVLYDFVL